ncbi:MAG: phage tail protein [Rhizobiales bacterium]|nr:phage tail protein [Hyphomicrobiales bacterium]
MLMTLGPIQFEVQPFNATDYYHAHEASFAEKPVVGASPPLEWVGEGPETWAIRARLFPHRFGGLGDLKKLHQARASGRPQYLMRGDGALMGWVVIERVMERSTYLDGNGIGRVIDIDIAVRRSSGPSNGSYFAVFSGLFA